MGPARLMRGRALASIALLCATWVTARIAVTTMDIRAVRQTDHGTYPNPVRMGSVPKLASAQTFTWQSPRHSVAARAVPHAQNSQAKNALPPEGTAPLFFSAGTPARISPPAAFLPTGPDVITPTAAPPPPATTPQGFEVYAYSFWRQGCVGDPLHAFRCRSLPSVDFAKTDPAHLRPWSLAGSLA